MILCIKLGCLQLLAMNCPSADRLYGAEQSEETEGWKQGNKMNDRLTCVLGVKEHMQSRRTGTNQGSVVRHCCCSEAVK